MKDAPTSMVAVADRRPRIALALGAGGAKGLTYIGVIEALERRGFEIVAIAGSSMGALIGGIYAAGKLDVYRDWVCSLARIDVLRLVDWTLSGGGLIKGERIIETLRGLIGEIDIEQLPMTYTAVATDIDRRREIWLTQGPLFDAIRASIAIPSIFRPHHLDGRRLVDGGLLNPLPVTPLLGASWDYMVAVGVNGPIEALPTAAEQSAHADEHEHADSYRKRIADFVGKLMPRGDEKPHEPGALELLNQSLDVMQANVSTAYEFHRARELIALGRTRADRILEHWTPHCLHGSHASVDDAEADPDESASA